MILFIIYLFFSDSSELYKINVKSKISLLTPPSSILMKKDLLFFVMFVDIQAKRFKDQKIKAIAKSCQQKL